ncbi:MAG: hypothetical protein LBF16_08420 [Pseudomonadales bacterium]|jgi:hypothetical protein|nr:hypothetical protein [Pseudomonadales bacterium]
MPLSLIELRDHNLRVRTQSALLAQSPGFANIAGEAPVFGEAARQQARLHPRHTFNQFWAQLNLDPLPLKSKHFRHSADLAYRHLDSLTRSLALDETVIAVPGSYTRNQLAVLLGIVKQCAFTPVGLVDLALLQAAQSPADDCLILDFHLHQAVLSGLRRIEGQLVRERVVPVPACGLVALQDAWLNLISDEFVRQCRFDPQRSADAEQFAANQLASWIAACQATGETTLEINLRGSVQQARLALPQFEHKVQNIFTRLMQEIDALRNPGTVLYISANQVNLPGLTRYIPGLITLDDDAMMNACLEQIDHIRRPPDNLQLITRLPLDGLRAMATPAPQLKAPTHLLFNHRALLLPQGRLTLGTPPAPLDSARIVPLPGFDGAVALLRNAKGVQLELHTPDPVLRNGGLAQNGQALVMGDTLQIGTNGPILQMIVVEGA